MNDDTATFRAFAEYSNVLPALGYPCRHSSGDQHLYGLHTARDRTFSTAELGAKL